MHKKPLILIAIPTCKRPIMLSECLESINQIKHPDNADVLILVADNDKNKTAKDVVKEFSKKANLPIKYSLCIDRGLSNIRNHLLDKAIEFKADYIACIDDDVLVDKTWLVNSYSALLKHKVDAIGPGNGLKANPRLSTESILMSAKIYRDLTMRYDLEFNFTGAEDDDFAKRAINAGAKFASDPSIKIYPQESDHREGWWLYIKHHYARFVTSAYNNRVENKRPISYFIFDIFFYFIKGVILIPFAIFSDSSKKRCLKSFIRCVAFPRSLFGKSNYQPYKNISGY